MDARHKLFEQMEVLKAKMEMTTSTNEKMILNATASAEAQMQANLRLLEEKQEISLSEERGKIKIAYMEKEIQRLKSQLHTIEGAHGHVSDKLTEAMGKIAVLNLSSPKSLNSLSGCEENASDPVDAMQDSMEVKKQAIELASFKREVDILTREVQDARKRNDELKQELRDTKIQNESLSHEKRKLKRSFERSQKALAQALSECRSLLVASTCNEK